MPGNCRVGAHRMFHMRSQWVVIGRRFRNPVVSLNQGRKILATWGRCLPPGSFTPGRTRTPTRPDSTPSAPLRLPLALAPPTSAAQVIRWPEFAYRRLRPVMVGGAL